MLLILAALALAPQNVVRSAETAPATAYLDVTVRYDRGTLSVVRVQRGEFKKPTTLRRYRGRFEARALSGATVCEFVPFDFPLLADDAVDDATTEALALGKRLRDGVNATTTVRLPLPAGADGAVIYDTRKKLSLTVTLPAATTR